MNSRNKDDLILFTSSDASPQSGAALKLFSMAEKIEEKGYHSVLVLPEDDDMAGEMDLNVKVEVNWFDLPRVASGFHIKDYLNFFIRSAKSNSILLKLIKKKGVSLVHANEILDLYAALAAKLGGVPLVWHIRTEFSTWPRARFIFPRIANLLADRIIVVSNSVKYHMFESQGLSPDKIEVIYDQGPDFKRFNDTVSGKRVREEFNMSDKEKMITLVGKLIELKGHETFIRSIPLVIKEFPKIKFFLVGGDLKSEKHQRYAEFIWSLPSDLNVEDHVIFTGFRRDIPEIMAASDIIVHSSINPDPFPGVVLQGMAVGKPVIASDLGGPREQIVDRASGVLVEPGDHRVLANEIIALLSDKQLQTELGKNAYQRVREEFNDERFFSNLDRVYQELLREN